MNRARLLTGIELHPLSITRVPIIFSDTSSTMIESASWLATSAIGRECLLSFSSPHFSVVASFLLRF